MSYWSIKSETLVVLEQKASMQILVRLLELGGKSKTVALMRNICAGNRAFYTALNVLIENKLVQSYQKYKGQERNLVLTERGKEIASKVVEIEIMLENNV